jgi:hypothetical protein
MEANSNITAYAAAAATNTRWNEQYNTAAVYYNTAENYYRHLSYTQSSE